MDAARHHDRGAWRERFASISQEKAVGAIEEKCDEFDESFGEMESLFSEFSRQVSGCGD